MVDAPTSPRDWLRLDDAALVNQCEVDHFRVGGPGGQNRNKVSSAVRLRHLPSGRVGTATEDRSQLVNRKRAVRRLRLDIALHLRGVVDASVYRPSAELTGYVAGGGSLHVNTKNPEYALIVCEVLDVLAVCGTRVSDAAALLGVSTGQLNRFLQGDSQVWQRVNHMRVESGLKPLHTSRT
jgi:hypothetical protein